MRRSNSKQPQQIETGLLLLEAMTPQVPILALIDDIIQVSIKMSQQLQSVRRVQQFSGHYSLNNMATLIDTAISYGCNYECFTDPQIMTTFLKSHSKPIFQKDSWCGKPQLQYRSIVMPKTREGKTGRTKPEENSHRNIHSGGLLKSLKNLTSSNNSSSVINSRGQIGKSPGSAQSQIRKPNYLKRRDEVPPNFVRVNEMLQSDPDIDKMRDKKIREAEQNNQMEQLLQGLVNRNSQGISQTPLTTKGGSRIKGLMHTYDYDGTKIQYKKKLIKKSLIQYTPIEHKQKIDNPKEKNVGAFRSKERIDTDMNVQNVPVESGNASQLFSNQPHQMKLQNGVYIMSEKTEQSEGGDESFDDQETRRTQQPIEHKKYNSFLKKSLLDSNIVNKENDFESKFSVFEKIASKDVLKKLSGETLSYILNEKNIASLGKKPYIIKSMQSSTHNKSLEVMHVTEEWKKDLIKQFRISKNNVRTYCGASLQNSLVNKSNILKESVKSQHKNTSSLFATLTPVDSYDLSILKSDKWGCQTSPGNLNASKKPIPSTVLSNHPGYVKPRDRSILNKTSRNKDQSK